MRPRPGTTEWPLAVFTVFAQAAAGLCVAHVCLRWFSPDVPAPGPWVPAVAVALIGLGALVAARHLGRRGAARFALANLETSWLSREVLFSAAFGFVTLASVGIGLLGVDTWALDLAAAALGVLLVDAIARVYRLRTVPAWDTWATNAAFFGTALLLGTAGLAGILVVVGTPSGVTPEPTDAALRGLGLAAALVTGLQLLMFVRQVRPKAARPVVIRRTVYGILGAAILLAYTWPGHGTKHAFAVGLAGALLLASELLGRFLFYTSHRRVGL